MNGLLEYVREKPRGLRIIVPGEAEKRRGLQTLVVRCAEPRKKGPTRSQSGEFLVVPALHGCKYTTLLLCYVPTLVVLCGYGFNVLDVVEAYESSKSGRTQSYTMIQRWGTLFVRIRWSRKLWYHRKLVGKRDQIITKFSSTFASFVTCLLVSAYECT